MKQKQLTDMLALCFVAIMPIEELTAVIMTINAAVFDVRKVATEADLREALSQPEITTIELAEHLVVESPVVINRQGKLTLDLAGHNLVACRRGHGGFSLGRSARNTGSVCVLDIQAGDVEVTGQGHIMALSSDSTAIRLRGAMTADNSNYACLFVDRDVVLNAPNYFGLVVAANGNLAYGVKVKFAGTLIARDGIYISSGVQGSGDNLPTIEIESGAKILVDEQIGTALCAGGQGIWNVDAAVLAGANGILLQAGTMHLCGAAITASGAPSENARGEAEHLGSVILMATPEGARFAPALTVAGGNYLSENGYVFVATARSMPLEKLAIKSGQFAGQAGIFRNLAPPGANNSVVAISGGNFASDVSAYLASGFCLEKNPESGEYQVINIAATRAEEKEAQVNAHFREKMDLAAFYLADAYSAGDLGPWKARIVPTLTYLKRVNTSAHKLLEKSPSPEKLIAATQSFAKAIKGVQDVEEELRMELATAIASVEAIEPQDYTAYSYRELTGASAAASKSLNKDRVELEELYSALLDIEINIDLLEEIEGEEVAEETEQLDPDELMIASASLAAEAEVAEPEDLELAAPEPPKLDAPRLGKLTLAVMPPNTKPKLLPALAVAAPLTPAPTLNLVTPKPAPIVDAPAPKIEAVAEPKAEPKPEPKSAPQAHSATDQARQNLAEMIAAVETLRISDYRAEAAEQFGELQVAITKAQALLAKPGLMLETIVEAMKEINAATAGLAGADEEVATPTPAPVAETAPAEVSWAALSEAIAKISALDAAHYTPNSYTWLMQCLEATKALLGSAETTQKQADEAVLEINLAINALEPVATPRLSTAGEFTQIAAPATQNNISIAGNAEINVSPSWLMSMMAGAYAGIAAYRQSRVLAKHRRRQA